MFGTLDLEYDASVRIGLKLRASRRAHGISQLALATELEMQPAHLSEVERGKRAINTERVVRAAVFLEEDPQEMLLCAGRIELDYCDAEIAAAVVRALRER